MLTLYLIIAAMTAFGLSANGETLDRSLVGGLFWPLFIIFRK